MNHLLKTILQHLMITLVFNREIIESDTLDNPNLPDENKPPKD